MVGSTGNGGGGAVDVILALRVSIVRMCLPRNHYGQLHELRMLEGRARGESARQSVGRARRTRAEVAVSVKIAPRALGRRLSEKKGGLRGRAVRQSVRSGRDSACF